MLPNTTILAKNEKQNSNEYTIEMKQDLLTMWMAYPEYVSGVEKVDNKVYLLLKSGNKLLYDDKREKSFEEKLNNPDIQDMLEQDYPLEDINKLMKVNYDPGRVRVYPILKEVYGKSSKEVQSKLIRVKMGNSSCSFTRENGGAEALRKTMDELMPIASNNAKIYKCVLPHMGTFNYRIISGTNRLSPHSFGIAIDLASNKWDYWKWTSRENGEKRLVEYPREIVKVFEKNNFVWGGKWGHFDILHFEYRPEILIKAKYFNIPSKSDNWYGDALEENRDIIKYIEAINGVVG